MSRYDLADGYRSARQRIAGVVRASGGDAVADQRVPSTPDWTVREVLAHLVGIVEDAGVGNLQGAPGDAWTAAQVERGRHKSVELLLEEWDDAAPALEAALAGGRGPMFVPLLMDIHAHEQDLRGALGAPGHREGGFYDWAVPLLASGFRSKALMHLDIDLAVATDRRRIGEEGLPTLVTTDWEYFRAAFGRRSAAQITAYEWTGISDPASLVEHLVVFGPASADLVE